MPTVRAIASAVGLPTNPVWRSYVGGRVLRQFRGKPDTDDNHFPEDWLASTVRARNGIHAQHEFEGLSRVENSESGPLLDDLLKDQPEFWFGTDCLKQQKSDAPRVLWKLLDSSVRLQVQAHPDAKFARQHLGSNTGKTECWYILSTRKEGYVYLGFQNPPDRDEWRRMIREQCVAEMLACFEKIPVQPEDCYVVPAGTPHAIGEGIFMLELQEPTDWVVRCEVVNAGLKLSPEACFMGLDLETCLDVFDYRAYSVEQVRKTFQQLPKPIRNSSAFAEEEVIGPAWHKYFRLTRLRGISNASWPGNELMLLIALSGQATLHSNSESQLVRHGETWLLPGCVPRWELLHPTSDWEILLAKLPFA